MSKSVFAQIVATCAFAIASTGSMQHGVGTRAHTTGSTRHIDFRSTHSGAQNRYELSPLSIATDGSKSPDRITDAVAYRHLVMALAARSAPSRAEAKRRTVLMTRMSLTNADSQALASAIAGVREQLDSIEHARSALSGDNPDGRAVLDSLRVQEHNVLDEARSRISQSLTAAGADRLQKFVVDYMKPRILVYGSELLPSEAR